LSRLRFPTARPCRPKSIPMKAYAKSSSSRGTSLAKPATKTRPANTRSRPGSCCRSCKPRYSCGTAAPGGGSFPDPRSSASIRDKTWPSDHGAICALRHPSPQSTPKNKDLTDSTPGLTSRIPRCPLPASLWFPISAIPAIAGRVLRVSGIATPKLGGFACDLVSILFSRFHLSPCFSITDLRNDPITMNSPPPPPCFDPIRPKMTQVDPMLRASAEGRTIVLLEANG
jgi:hypothetical protein